MRGCLEELANRYAGHLTADIRLARDLRSRAASGAVSSKNGGTPNLSYVLCAKLLENLEQKKSLDCIALRVILCWCAGRGEEARRLLLAACVAVFEAVPQCADFSDLCDSPLMRQARQCFLLCMSANLQLVLTLAFAPSTHSVLHSSCWLSLGVAATAAISVRTALTFGCIDHRYDIVLKILKHPPKFRLAIDSPETQFAARTMGGAAAAQPQPLSPISASASAAAPSSVSPSGGTDAKERDRGYAYLKRISRAEAISMLQSQPPGTFLIRPHDTQSEVLFLSFVSGGEDGVKHAIVRREIYVRADGQTTDEAGLAVAPDTGRRHHQYRCGKIGPCKTLDETLRSISLILPCRLLFTEDADYVAAAVPPNKPPPASSVSSVSGEGLSVSGSQVAAAKPPVTRDGGFVCRVSDCIKGMRHKPALSLLDLQWDGNAEFWWEMMYDNKDGDSISANSGATQYGGESNRIANIAALSAMDKATEGAETAVHAESHMDPAMNRSLSDGNLLAAASNEKGSIEDLSAAGASDHHRGFTVSLNSKEKRRGNEDRRWGIPLQQENLGSLVRGVIQLLTVKTMHKQISGNFEVLRKLLLHSDMATEAELSSLINLKLNSRLPRALLPFASSVGSKDRSASTAAAAASSAIRADSRGGAVVRGIGGAPLCAIDHLLFPLSLFACVSERAMMSVLCPPLPLDPESLSPPGLIAGEGLAQLMVSETDGVPLRLVRIPHSALSSHLGFTVAHTANALSATAAASQDQVVECFDLADGVQWLSRNAENDIVNTVGCYIVSASDPSARTDDMSIPDPNTVVRWLWKRGYLQNIVIGANAGGSGGGGSGQVLYRYVDPWEVSVVTDQTAVLTSCRLGRLWLGPVSAYGANDLVEMTAAFLRDTHERETLSLQIPSVHPALSVRESMEASRGLVDQPLTSRSLPIPDALLDANANVGAVGDKGFLRLWETLRAEAWLVMCISSAIDQAERESGGPEAAVDASITGLSVNDPYHRCISRYLYRNALFRRVYLPHRFVAMIQVDTFVLKDLAPHKFKAGVASAPIEVYGVLRLIRSGGGGGVKKTDALKKGFSDIVVTPSRRAETARTASTSQPSEYLWREQAVLRFPLPDSVLAVNPFCEDGSRMLRQPPRKLQLSVYETRSLFADQKLGDLELPLSALTDDKPFREWLPLSSEKGSAWFIRIQLQLRFLLMAHDSDRERNPDSSTIRYV